MRAALALAALFAPLLALIPPRAGAQELGRLFFTPDQRAALDARRKARVPDKPAATPQAEEPTMRVNGVVRRSGGKSTVWINSEPMADDPRRAGAHPGDKSDSVSVPVGESAQRYELRVGETLDRGSGEVRDVVGKDAVKVGPRGAPPAK